MSELSGELSGFGIVLSYSAVWACSTKTHVALLS